MNRIVVAILILAILLPIASLNVGCDDTRFEELRSGIMDTIFGNLATGVQTVVTEVANDAVDEVLDFLDLGHETA